MDSFSVHVSIIPSWIFVHDIPPKLLSWYINCILLISRWVVCSRKFNKSCAGWISWRIRSKPIIDPQRFLPLFVEHEQHGKKSCTAVVVKVKILIFLKPQYVLYRYRCSLRKTKISTVLVFSYYCKRTLCIRYQVFIFIWLRELSW